MRKKSFFCTVTAVLFSAFGHGVQVPVKSSIVQVSLFRDGALVTRQGSVRVPAGETTLVFENLPREVDPSSLQARLVDDSLGYIRNAKIYRPERPEVNPIVEQVQNRLDEVEKDQEKHGRIISEAKEAIDFAKGLRVSFSQEFGKLKAGGAKALEDATELAKFVSVTQSEAYSRIDSAEGELKLIEKKKGEIEKELQRAKQAASLLSSQAEVEIETEAIADIDIRLTYLAESATWEPQYELRAFPKKQTLDFGYYASISQNTGDDWANTSLSLHTNRVHRQGNVPELRPLHIRNKMDFSHDEGASRTHRRKKYSKYGNPDSSFESYSMKHSLDGLDEETLIDQEATITESTVSFQATIPGQVTVLSSPESKTFKVVESTIEAEYWSESVPRLQLDAYLRAKICNTLNIPILPGRAIAFVDGELSSKVYLGKVLPKEAAKVSLGIDGSVVVRRTKGALKDSNTGFYVFGETKTLTREYINEVTNLHGVDHTIVLVDQWPIAREEKISIERKEPKEDEVHIEDMNNGIFEWNATLAPKQKRAFTTAYDIIYPRDMGLSMEL